MFDQNASAELLHKLASTVAEIAALIKEGTATQILTSSTPALEIRAEPQRLTTQWPRIGDYDLTAGPYVSIEDPIFQREFRPGQSVSIYSAGCTALSRLAATY